MFCSKCGKELPEGAAFCANCGTPVGQTDAPEQPVKSSAGSEAVQKTVNNCLNVIKGFINPNTVTKTVADEAKSNGFEFIPMLALAWLGFAFAASMVLRGGLNGIFKSLIGDSLGGMGAFFDAGSIVSGLVSTMLPFGLTLLVSLLVGAVALAVVVFGLWGAARLIYKKNVALVPALNMVGTALLPLTVVSLLNILLAVIWAPLAIVAFLTALAVSVILLYIGFQKLDTFENSPLLGFALVTLVTVVLVLLFAGLLYPAVIAGGLEDLGNSIGSMFDLF